MEKSNTSTIILVVGILAIVLVVVMNSGGKKVTNTTSNAGYMNGLFGLGGAIASAVGKIRPGTSGGPVINAGTYHPDTSDFSISGNTLDDASGQAVTYGTD
jgi:hypothetical protein